MIGVAVKSEFRMNDAICLVTHALVHEMMKVMRKRNIPGRKSNMRNAKDTPNGNVVDIIQFCHICYG